MGEKFLTPGKAEEVWYCIKEFCLSGCSLYRLPHFKGKMDPVPDQSKSSFQRADGGDTGNCRHCKERAGMPSVHSPAAA